MPSWEAAVQQADVWLEMRLPSPKTTSLPCIRRMGWTTWTCWPKTAVMSRERVRASASPSCWAEGAVMFSSPQWMLTSTARAPRRRSAMRRPSPAERAVPAWATPAASSAQRPVHPELALVERVGGGGRAHLPPRGRDGRRERRRGVEDGVAHRRPGGHGRLHVADREVDALEDRPQVAEHRREAVAAAPSACACSQIGEWMRMSPAASTVKWREGPLSGAAARAADASCRPRFAALAPPPQPTATAATRPTAKSPRQPEHGHRGRRTPHNRSHGTDRERQRAPASAGAPLEALDDFGGDQDPALSTSTSLTAPFTMLSEDGGSG